MEPTARGNHASLFVKNGSFHKCQFQTAFQAGYQITSCQYNKRRSKCRATPLELQYGLLIPDLSGVLRHNSMSYMTVHFRRLSLLFLWHHLLVFDGEHQKSQRSAYPDARAQRKLWYPIPNQIGNRKASFCSEVIWQFFDEPRRHQTCSRISSRICMGLNVRIRIIMRCR